MPVQWSYFHLFHLDLCCLIFPSGTLFPHSFLLTLTTFFFYLPPGSDCIGGQRHHQLQATSHPAVGHPCQPVWLSHREGRGKNKGDQRGEQPEHKSIPSRLVEHRNRKRANLFLEICWSKNCSWK